MQIVIDIPEDVLGFIYTNGFIKQEDRDVVNHAILGCIELPKKHGRIGDLDALANEIPIDVCSGFEVTDIIEAAPTLIEADEEE